jgi:HSP20 family protein
MDEKNIEVTVSSGMLTLKGEKTEEKEEKEKDYYLSERSYGSFQRSFPIPDVVDVNKIEASFARGLLTIKLPKSAEAQSKAKKIAIKSA